MYDIVALGELLIDFTPSGYNNQNALLFSRNPGGAPANVLAVNCKLGGSGAFIGKVGDDMFGDFLTETLGNLGISTKGIVKTKSANTTIAFVQLDSNGERSFSFYRRPGADMLLNDEDISEDLLKNGGIFHFGSLSLTDEPARSATIYAVKKAKENGAIVSYDPNYRPLLWKSLDEAKEQMSKGLCYADIVKISDEELFLLTGEKNFEIATKQIQGKGPALILVSMGKDGAFYRYKDICKKISTFNVDVVDTTGAGDAFLGAILYKLRGTTKEGLQHLTESGLDEILKFGNAAGALMTTKHGAIFSCPEMNDIDNLLKQDSYSTLS